MKVKKILIIFTIVFCMFVCRVEAAPSKWALPEVDTAINRKLVPSDLQDNYQKNISREQFCNLIASLFEVYTGQDIKYILGDKVENLNVFNDVSSINVNACYMLGIINGKQTKVFDPNGNLTREEAAKILSISMKYFMTLNSKSNIKYNDEKTIGAWAKEYVYYVTDNKIMNGFQNGTGYDFMPKGTYTIEQAIVTINRVYDMILKTEQNQKLDLNSLVDIESKTKENFTAIGGTTKLLSYLYNSPSLEYDEEGNEIVKPDVEVKINVIQNDGEFYVEIGDSVIIEQGKFNILKLVDLNDDGAIMGVLYLTDLNEIDWAYFYSIDNSNTLEALVKVPVNGIYSSYLKVKDTKVFSSYDIVGDKVIGYTEMGNTLNLRRSLEKYPINNVKIIKDLQGMRVTCDNQEITLTDENIKKLGITKDSYIRINEYTNNYISFTATATGKNIIINFIDNVE